MAWHVIKPQMCHCCRHLSRPLTDEETASEKLRNLPRATRFGNAVARPGTPAFSLPVLYSVPMEALCCQEKSGRAWEGRIQG